MDAARAWNEDCDVILQRRVPDVTGSESSHSVT